MHLVTTVAAADVWGITLLVPSLGIAEAEIDALGARDKAKKHMHISKA